MANKLLEGIKKFRRRIGAQFSPLWLREQLLKMQTLIEDQHQKTNLLIQQAGLYSYSSDILESETITGLDIFLLNFFKNKTKGFFLELGAYDGITSSPTYYLEKIFLWSGILIEPNKSKFDLIKDHRNEDIITLNTAISSTETKVNFHLSDMQSAITQSINKSQDIVEIPARRLDDIFEEHNITHIDYVSLDVEGNEYDALQSINFDKVNITLIAIESLNYQQQKQIDEFMTSKNFTFIRKMCLDYFYVNNNYTS